LAGTHFRPLQPGGVDCPTVGTNAPWEGSIVLADESRLYGDTSFPMNETGPLSPD